LTPRKNPCKCCNFSLSNTHFRPFMESSKIYNSLWLNAFKEISYIKHGLRSLRKNDTPLLGFDFFGNLIILKLKIILLIGFLTCNTSFKKIRTCICNISCNEFKINFQFSILIFGIFVMFY
jgi:hypothetical protein